ncbi:unnamed protein product [Clavelina lepadiformis]|uniref:Uncharacterized protein n=1 Tax=Clavelina lepadiformis TaxID=159417 RepID=A0ABP0H236_CLALP
MSSPTGKNTPKWWKIVMSKAQVLHRPNGEKRHHSEDSNNVYEDIQTHSDSSSLEDNDYEEYTASPYRRRSLSDTFITVSSKTLQESLKRKILKKNAWIFAESKPSSPKSDSDAKNLQRTKNLQLPNRPSSSFTEEVNAKMKSLGHFRSRSQEGLHHIARSSKEADAEKIEVDNVLYSSVFSTPTVSECSTSRNYVTRSTSQPFNEPNESTTETKVERYNPLYDCRDSLLPVQQLNRQIIVKPALPPKPKSRQTNASSMCLEKVVPTRPKTTTYPAIEDKTHFAIEDFSSSNAIYSFADDPLPYS